MLESPRKGRSPAWNPIRAAPSGGTSRKWRLSSPPPCISTLKICPFCTHCLMNANFSPANVFSGCALAGGFGGFQNSGQQQPMRTTTEARLALMARIGGLPYHRGGFFSGKFHVYLQFSPCIVAARTIIYLRP